MDKKPFEQAVESLDETTSPFGLDLDKLKAGLDDACKRIETLEAEVAALKAVHAS